MNRTSSLILGLGGVGGIVAQELRARLVDTPQGRAARFLLLDAPGPDGPPGSLRTSDLPAVEPIPLSMEAVREILATSREWTPHLAWLTRFERGQLLDELRPYGTAGYRCLGRLALLRSAEVIDRTLRRHLYALQEEAPTGAPDAILIAGAGGGLGSSILADLTFLLQRLEQTASRTACLILPPAGEAGRSRFQANTFATICEAFALKTRKVSWENRFEQLPAIDVEPRSCEPWQRFYLFQAGIDELPPYEATARRVAEALALQLSPEIAKRRHMSSQDLPVLDLHPSSFVPRSEAGFSACYGTALDPATLSETIVQAQQDSRPVLSIDPFLLDEAVKMLIETLDQDFLALRAVLFQKRKKELADLHSDLSARERALLYTILPPPERDDSPALKLDPQAVLRLHGAEKALRWLWAEIQKPAPAIPPAPPPPLPGNLLSARQQIADLEELREDASLFWKEASAKTQRPADGKRPKARFRYVLRLQRDMLWNLAQRFSSAQSLLRARELHDAMCEAFIEILRGWKRQEDGAEETIRSFPTLETWLHRLEADLKNVAQGVFLASAPQPERRQFAWLILPGKLPGELSRKELQRRIEGIVKDKLLCNCETAVAAGKDDNGQIRFYYEDLFRSPKEIRNLAVFRRAYQDEPRREILHTDQRFLERGTCTQLGGADFEAPTTCGNPDCEVDIRAHPMEATICPGCHQNILSRCGNPGCKVTNLHRRPEAHNRTCPGCGGVNHAAWWICCRHGKIDYYVPVDKDACPECIRRHHENPAAFPLDQVGRRPDIQGNRTCTHCEELAKEDPNHPVFRIPAELEPFVDQGVNGHDRQRFLELAKKHKMRDNNRCPNCGTLLIPVDHRGEAAQ
jgi:hypothetical protein